MSKNRLTLRFSHTPECIYQLYESLQTLVRHLKTPSYTITETFDDIFLYTLNERERRCESKINLAFAKNTTGTIIINRLNVYSQWKCNPHTLTERGYTHRRPQMNHIFKYLNSCLLSVIIRRRHTTQVVSVSRDLCRRITTVFLEYNSSLDISPPEQA